MVSRKITARCLFRHRKKLPIFCDEILSLPMLPSVRSRMTVGGGGLCADGGLCGFFVFTREINRQNLPYSPTNGNRRFGRTDLSAQGSSFFRRAVACCRRKITTRCLFCQRRGVGCVLHSPEGEGGPLNEVEWWVRCYSEFPQNSVVAFLKVTYLLR